MNFFLPHLYKALRRLFGQSLLKQPLDWLDNVERAQKSSRLPVVFTRAEVQAILAHLDGSLWLMASLLYGSGLRLMECLRLRVKDVDFSLSQVIVRDGKGGRDRITILPDSIRLSMQRHLAKVKALHKLDLDEGYGEVYLPFALERKYRSANREWHWQYVFPASKRSVDPRSQAVDIFRRLRGLAGAGTRFHLLWISTHLASALDPDRRQPDVFTSSFQ